MFAIHWPQILSDNFSEIVIRISNSIVIRDEELEFSAIRSQGAGGQNVNKVSSAIHLRFDIKQSSLPELYKQRLLDLKDHRINKDGILIVKAQRYRSQEKNKADAIERFREIIQRAMIERKPRRATKPTKTSQQKRLNSKTQRGKTKALRGRVDDS